MAVTRIDVKLDEADYYKATVNSRTSFNSLVCIKQKLSRRALKKFQKWCFGAFLKLEKFNLSGHLIHQIMLRCSAISDKALWFDIDGTEYRFSMEEFALITGLNCDEIGDAGHASFDEAGGHVKARVLDLYLGGRRKLSLQNLDALFRSANEHDHRSMTKFAMLYFLESFLMGVEARNCCPEEHITMVDDIASFNKYPWGRVCFDITIRSFTDVVLRGREVIKSGKKVKPTAYTLRGFPYALQVWAYETFTALSSNFGIRIATSIPRILNWKTRAVIKEKDLMVVVEDNWAGCTRLIPNIPGEREAEYLRFFSTNAWTSLYGYEIPDERQLVVAVREPTDFDHSAGAFQAMSSHTSIPAEAQPEELPRVYRRRPKAAKKADNASKGKYAQIFANIENLQKRQEEFQDLKNDIREVLQFKDMLEKLVQKEDKADHLLALEAKIEQLLERQDKMENAIQYLVDIATRKNHEGLGRDELKVGDTSKLPVEPAADNESEDDFFSDDDGGDMRQNTPDQPIVPPAPEPSFAESCHIYTSPEVKKFNMVPRIKRRRLPSKYVRTPYMAPSTRVRRAISYGPDAVANMEEEHSLKKWLAEDDSVEPVSINLKWMVIDRLWFRTLRTPKKWLIDEHIDGAFWAMRKDVMQNPDSVPVPCAIMDTVWSNVVLTMYQEWEQNPEIFWLDDQVLETYPRGERLYDAIPWTGVSKVFFPINLGDNHWVLGEADFNHSKIIIYDSDIYLYADKHLQPLMLPYSVMIPWIAGRMELKTDGEVEKVEGKDAVKWPVVRITNLPQQKNGYDCGVFTIRFLELLIHGLELNDRCGQMWMNKERDRLSVKLWGYRDW